jgi:hypothetical protein
MRREQIRKVPVRGRAAHPIQHWKRLDLGRPEVRQRLDEQAFQRPDGSAAPPPRPERGGARGACSDWQCLRPPTRGELARALFYAHAQQLQVVVNGDTLGAYGFG